MSDIVQASPNDSFLSTEVIEAPANPALVYLASLSTAKSRRAQEQSLKRILRLLRVAEAVSAFPWQSLRYEHCQLIRTQLASSCAPATANLSLAALRGCMKAAWRLRLISTDDYHRARDIAPVRGSREPKGRHVSPGEIRELFSACIELSHRDKWLGSRNSAVIALLFGTGLRRAELVALNLGDIDAETGKLTVLGKGNKQRATFLPPGSAQAIKSWLSVRGPGSNDEPLFLSGRRGFQHRRISEGGVLYALRQAGTMARVKPYTPHDLRRTFIGELLDAGADIASIQKMVGHSSPTTTGRYDRRDERTKQRNATLLHVPFQTPEDQSQ